MAFLKAKTSGQATTMLEAMLRSLEAAARHHPGVDERPAAVLWSDPRGEWRPLIALLRERLPQLLTLGSYDPSTRTGPAIWLKCMISRTINGVELPPDVAPVIYLPEVSRQDLRAGDECPVALRPLVELQYRGVVWTQNNGRDWTVDAFLVSEQGLGLDVSRDAATRRSIDASLAVLAEAPLSPLRGKRLEAEDFDRLMIGDQPRDLLSWINSPTEAQKQFHDAGKWHAFRNRCRNDYGFDPEADGETAAGESLGMREGDVWAALWERYCESPALYPKIPDLLTRSKPSKGKLLFDKESWPDENDSAEASLRQSLESLATKTASEARAAIRTLEAAHASRRQWVWARLGRSPLALALGALALLADRTETHLGGESAAEMAELYEKGGYLADDAALRALSATGNTVDRQAVREAVRAMYLPWLEQAAERLQRLTAKKPLPTLANQPTIEAERGACIFFADGLRFDLGQRVAQSLRDRGLKVTVGRRWSALPCVTATAKPAVSPIARMLTGQGLPNDYAPSIQSTGEELTYARFQKLLKQAGYELLPSDSADGPSTAAARGWAEFGNIDKRGHDMQIELAGQLEDELHRLIDRVVSLLDAGWKSIRLVTDHGWLLMPGDLPKQELPHYLTESKWSRCARIKGESQMNVPTAAWSWNQAAEYASAPGACVFSKGYAYSHGGISLQECLIPDIFIEPPADDPAITATIGDVQWRGLRVRLTIEPFADLQIDIRTSAANSASSVTGGLRAAESEGKVSLLVEDEELAGTAAVIVVLDQRGRIVGNQSTIVGGEE